MIPQATEATGSIEIVSSIRRCEKVFSLWTFLTIETCKRNNAGLNLKAAI